jgi:hypothetical protein
MFSHAINQIREMNISMVISFIQTRHELAFQLDTYTRPCGIYKAQKKRESLCLCKVPEMQKRSKIFIEPIHTWLNRARRADQEYRL